MIILQEGINTIYISNQGFVSGSTFEIQFESALLIETKTLTTYATGMTTRFVTFDITLVEEGQDNLLANELFLVKGSHQITVTQGDLDYTDILFVEFDALTDKKYTTSKKIHIYKKN
jgi:hypothetical protein